VGATLSGLWACPDLVDRWGRDRQNKAMSESIKKKPRRYDENFKRQAVSHWRNSGRPRKQVAQELGINHWMLRSWDRQFRSEQVTSSAATKAELEAENRKLREELLRVREQRDILKKTLGILSTP
jgi:transposase